MSYGFPGQQYHNNNNYGPPQGQYGGPPPQGYPPQQYGAPYVIPGILSFTNADIARPQQQYGNYGPPQNYQTPPPQQYGYNQVSRVHELSSGDVVS